MQPAIVTLNPGDRLLNFALPDTAGVQRIFYYEVGGAPSLFLAVESLDAAAQGETLAMITRQMAEMSQQGVECYVLSGGTPAANKAAAERLGIAGPVFSDPQGQMLSRLLNPEPPLPPETQPFRPKVALYALDPNQRVLAAFRRPPLETAVAQAAAVFEAWRQGQEAGQFHFSGAPVLLLPRVFDPHFCSQLIGIWQANHREGGLSDGTRNVLQPDKKRNLEHLIEDDALSQRISRTLARRIGPELKKVFNYQAPFGFEAFNVMSYRDDRQDFFGLHRDTLRQQRQRRFALSLNLNDGYEGGALRFPEYGPHSYAPEAGGALLFSASLLHEALPVTKGQRWVMVTFLCDPE